MGMVLICVLCDEWWLLFIQERRWTMYLALDDQIQPAGTQVVGLRWSSRCSVDWKYETWQHHFLMHGQKLPLSGLIMPEEYWEFSSTSYYGWDSNGLKRLDALFDPCWQWKSLIFSFRVWNSSKLPTCHWYLMMESMEDVPFITFPKNVAEDISYRSSFIGRCPCPESRNTVMDENKKLCLNSGEIIVTRSWNDWLMMQCTCTCEKTLGRKTKVQPVSQKHMFFFLIVL